MQAGWNGSGNTQVEFKCKLAGMEMGIHTSRIQVQAGWNGSGNTQVEFKWKLAGMEMGTHK